MRIRTLKPEWLDDELLNDCSDAARVLSAGLVLLSDDYGRGRARIGYIAGHVWSSGMEKNPRETLARASGALRELLGIGYVALYEVDGQSYFAIRNWKKHQRVDHPGKPIVPEPLGDPRETLARPSRDPSETLAPDRDRDRDLDREVESSRDPRCAQVLALLTASAAATDLECATPDVAERLLGVADAAGRPMDHVLRSVGQALAEADMAHGSSDRWTGDRLRRVLRSFVEARQRRPEPEPDPDPPAPGTPFTAVRRLRTGEVITDG